MNNVTVFENKMIQNSYENLYNEECAKNKKLEEKNARLRKYGKLIVEEFKKLGVDVGKDFDIVQFEEKSHVVEDIGALTKNEVVKNSCENLCQENQNLIKQIVLLCKKNIPLKTTQLRNEEKHITQFRNNCSLFGLEYIGEWGVGAKNKRLNKDADIDVKIINLQIVEEKFGPLDRMGRKWDTSKVYTVSCKTEKGDFTWANGGTTVNGTDLFKNMSLTEEEINNFIESTRMVHNIKAELGKGNTWKEIGEDKKEPIKVIYISQLYNIFYDKLHNIATLYQWRNDRQSDFKYVGDKLIVPKKYGMPDNVAVTKLSINSIRVGHFKLRVKSSGGKVKSSWKINYETYIPGAV